MDAIEIDSHEHDELMVEKLVHDLFPDVTVHSVTQAEDTYKIKGEVSIPSDLFGLVFESIDFSAKVFEAGTSGELILWNINLDWTHTQGGSNGFIVRDSFYSLKSGNKISREEVRVLMTRA